MATIHTIKGTIYDQFNNPMPKHTVEIYDQDLRQVQLLGKTETNANGTYQLEFDVKKALRADVKSVDAFITIKKPRGRKALGRSKVHFNIPEEYTLDFKIDGTNYIGLSEFVKLINMIRPLLEGQKVDFQDLKEDDKHQDISFLSNETQIDQSILALLPIAFKHHISSKTKIPAAIFYGLLRLQFPVKLNELVLIQSESLQGGIEKAIESNIISKRWEKEISEIVKVFNTLSSRVILKSNGENQVAFQAMVQATLPTKKLQKIFIDTHLANDVSPENFWKELDSKPEFTAKHIRDIQNVFRLNLLTEQPIVATALLKLQKSDASLKTLRDYTKLTKTDFEKTIISSDIKTFPKEVEGRTKKQKIGNYAITLERQLKELFPTDAFKNRMIQDQNHPFGAAKTDLKTFLSKNPDFDLKTTKLEHLIETSDFRGIRNKERTKKELNKINRLQKIGSDYDNTRAILKAGLSSAFDVAQMSKSEFVKSVATAGIGKKTAIQLHKEASLIDNRTTALATKFKTENDTPLYVINANTDISADYLTLFGETNSCDCEHCQSVYSPSAYFVDMLNYMKNEAPNAFKELFKRRPDLGHILLTCKNTNTVLPYIDLVNEILENQIADNGQPQSANTAPQTNLSAQELAAFPEHVRTEVYSSKLSTSFSSFQLPFHLHLEETRIYLDKLNFKRYELMELFYGKKGNHKYSDLAIATEYLGLSENELRVINGDGEAAVANIPTNKVSDFLVHTGLTYVELLRLLECTFINPLLPNNTVKRTIKIEADDTVLDDEKTTCDINKLELKGLDDITTKHMLRFIRLWKKLDWDILDLDRAFSALEIKKEDFDNAVDEVNTNLIIPLSHILRIKHTYSIAIPEILSLWAAIPTETYIDKTNGDQPTIGSFYDSLFKNKKVSNPLDLHFTNPKNFPNSETLETKSSIIAAAYNISESDLNLITTFQVNQTPIVDGKLSLENLSVIYRYVALAKMLHLSVEELLLLIEMTGVNPFRGKDNTLDTFLFLEKVRLIRSSGFSFLELSKLLKVNPSNESHLDPNVVGEVLASLGEGLNNIDLQFRDLSLNDIPDIDEKISASKEALITDSLSNAFNADSKIIRVMLNDMVKFTGDETKASIFPFIKNDEAIASTNANNEIVWTNPHLVNTYSLLSKTWKRLTQLMNKFSITAEEFIYLQANEDKLNLTGIWHLPTNTSQFDAFENLFNICQFKNKLAEPTEDWFTLFDSNIKNDFLESLKSLTKIETTTMLSLAKNDALNLTFPDDFLNGKNLANLIDCVEKANQYQSSTENISTLTIPNPGNTEVLMAKNILKAKYDEKTWLEIIKPISNQIRGKKRNALVEYLLTAATTKAFRTNNSVLNSNDLFAHFLIDTEMAPCMMTSRIKQAISSVQLFIDRCLMGLETGIQLDKSFTNQWNEWRKVYRVWEANRKVFIYPENWIEPELRDDKSPFFKELESKLTQNEVTDDIAKDALLEYLEKLDVVANLKIVGFFQDSNKITHVLGRTKNIPHQYFYRKQEKSVWTAWEKVELDIQGNHILMVVWNNRLMVFWGVFTEKQMENSEGTSPIKESNGNFNSDKPKKYLEMKLNWSEFKNKKWGTKKISEEVLRVDYPKTTNAAHIIKTLFLRSFINLDGQLFIRLFKPKEYAPKQDIKAKRMFFYVSDTGSNSTSNSDNPIVSYKMAPGLGSGTGGNFGGNTNFNNNIFDGGDKFAQPPVLPKDSFRFGNCNGKPRTTHGQSIVGESNLLKVENVIFNYPVFTEKNNKKESLKIAGSEMFLSQNSGSIGILDKTPGTYSLLPNHHENSKSTSFFYSSEKNSFYVNPHRFSLIGHSKFNFQMFYHPFICDYIKALNTQGIDALYDESIQQDFRALFTDNLYQPTVNLKGPYPEEKVDFSLEGSFSIYNWELFFHIPLLIATRLSQNQKFEEARKWFHYIFDPTKAMNQTQGLNNGAKKFWITKPFKEQIDKSSLSIEALINQQETSGELSSQLRNWEDNPFNPHAVARFRNTAYMRTTVMKYIDNLTAWGDQLFRRDSIESINEATLLYVLSANILGKRPENVPPKANLGDFSFNSIAGELNPFSTAKVTIESFLSPSDSDEFNTNVPIEMPLFCLPKNNKLIGYWDTVADKLFKIRNCMNIDGVVRELPLFQPAIDPLFMIRAKAAGLDLNTILNDTNALLPNYRFQFILQKANEFCNDVKSLGNQLLTTLEKKDAEELSLLRTVHETKLLELIRDIKRQQIDEAKENLEALNCTKKVVEERKNYYSSKSYKNDQEKSYLDSLNSAALYQNLQGANQIIASVMAAFPEVTIGGWSWGVTTGGNQLAKISNSIGASLGAASNYELTQGNIANVEGGYDRRQEDWDFQVKTSELELKQIEKQILAAEIREAIAIKDLNNHEIQIEQAKKVDDFMRSKFTNSELYNYMTTKISSMYFQTYQMAYDFAKKAEKCYQFDLGIRESSFIKFGYWDSLKKGLLSGEKLQFDLRRLEASFLENNKREFEITKHISLRRLDPFALLKLKTKEDKSYKCEFVLPEWLFDMDCPGHYKRRIKSVGLSIPCITGPYTSVNCKLELTSGEIRINPDISNDPADVNVINRNSNIKSIVTSSAQNDNGMFEGNLRDERYLPFEGAGIMNSSWNLELPETKQFDYNTISDVIMHISYTALDGGEAIINGETFKKKVISQYKNKLKANNEANLYRLLNLQHDFPNEWNTFITEGNVDFSAELKEEHFPYFATSSIRTIVDKTLFKIKDDGTLNLEEGKNLNSTNMIIEIDKDELKNQLDQVLASFVIVRFKVDLD